jgi:AcrR family transcriptional regulator
MSAEERREEILAVAMEAFARGGLNGTSTEAIAAKAGISQPYLFRLFHTKKELFLACYMRQCTRILESFQQAAEGKSGEDALHAMGEAYAGLLGDQTSLQLQLQGFAASAADAEISSTVREGFGRIYRHVHGIAGGDDERTRQFFATGMLMTVIAAMDLPGSKTAWEHGLIHFFGG